MADDSTVSEPESRAAASDSPAKRDSVFSSLKASALRASSSPGRGETSSTFAAKA